LPRQLLAVQLNTVNVITMITIMDIMTITKNHPEFR
jgi:hypothetical protein